ncbi:hypothetical protein [Methanosarcina horonobensis]|uniref:hypothetical protein n=1 Tax=Methanosarcina horonobensis TaxID=418008 RepID=UPI0022B8BAD5|nr:hypothetical protein [Methanosarcina horonobensis]
MKETSRNVKLDVCLKRKIGQTIIFEILRIRQKISFFLAAIVHFCRMSMVSLKRGSYSGSNGGIFLWIFPENPTASTRGSTGFEPSFRSTVTPSGMHPEISGPYLV